MGIKKLLCILIPDLSNKYWLFVFFIIGSLFRKMIPSILSDYVFSIRKKKIKFQDERREIYYDIICNVASDLLTGIPHCISQKNQSKKEDVVKKKKTLLQKKKLKIKYIYNDQMSNSSLLIKILFIISTIDFTCQLLFFGNCIIQNSEYFNDSNNSNTIIRNDDHLYSFLVIDIVARYIFSSLLLKTYFYTHHYLSFVLNLFAIIIFFYIDLVFKFNEYSTINKIMIVIRYILYSLEDIMNKLALIYLFINPESLLFYKGLFSLVYLFLFTLIVIIYEKIKGGLKIPTIDNLFIANMLCRAFFIIFNIIRSFFIVKVIDVFSSQHISFLRVLETIVLFIYYKIDSYYKRLLTQTDKETNILDNYFHLEPLYEMIEVGGFIILLFSTLVHNEIIILNCDRYKKFTIYYLNVEADKEKKKMHLNENSTIDIINDNSEFSATYTSINDEQSNNLTNSF